MITSHVSHVSIDLGSDPDGISTYVWATDDGERAVLNLGPDVSVHVSRSTPEALERLAALALELAERQRQQVAPQGVAA